MKALKGSCLHLAIQLFSSCIYIYIHIIALNDLCVGLSGVSNQVSVAFVSVLEAILLALLALLALAYAGYLGNRT